MSSQTVDAAEFLAEVEALPIRESTSHLREFARERHDDEQFGMLLRELSERYTFGAEISLLLAHIANRSDHIGSLLRSGDPDVARYALRLAVDFGELDALIEDAVLDGALESRRVAYRALRVRRRADLADRLIGRVRESFGDAEAARLLPACGSGVVRDLLPELSYAVTGWGTLAHRHPQVFADYAEAALGSMEKAQWTEWWTHHRDGLADAVHAEPGRWIEILGRHWVDEPLLAVADSILPRLITADPEAAWRLVRSPACDGLAHRVSWRPNIMRRLAASDTETIAAVIGKRAQQMQPAVIGHVAPSRREEVLLATRVGHQKDLWHRFMTALPKSLRHREARKRLALRKVAESRQHRETLRAHLPFAEVRDELVEATWRSSADERAGAYRHLVTCAGLDGPEAIADMLGCLDRLPRDQDTVLFAALQALAEVPAPMWREEHLERIGQLTDAVLASPRRTRDTDAALLRLASRIVLIGPDHGRPAFTEFGYERLVRVAGESGSRDVAEAARRLPRPVAVEWCRRLVPVLANQAELGRFKLLLRLADVIERDARAVPGFASLLLTASAAGDTSTARRAAAQLVSFEEHRVGELVEADPSLAGVPKIFDRLARDRVDLMAAWLESDADDRSVLRRSIGRTVSRHWAPAVREAYLAALASYAVDQRRSASDRGLAVRNMANVAGLTAEHVEQFLRIGDPLIEASALAALDAVTPVEQAWELLAAHGPGAEVGLGRVARRMRPSALAGTVDALLGAEPVAVRKQGVRLLLRHRLPGAEEQVRRLWAEERTLPSVREAIVAELLHRINEPWAREIVADSIRFGADVAAPAVSVEPLAVPAGHRDEYGDLVAAAVRSGDERVMETALAGVTRWARFSERVADALVALASDLDTTARWGTALSALSALAVDGGEWGPLVEAVRLLREDDRVEPNATAERDLPVAQRLSRLVSLLDVHRGGRYDSGVPESLIALLPTELGTRLLFTAVPWSAGADELRRLAGRIGDSIEAYKLADGLQLRMSYQEEADVLPFFERLVASGDARACVLAASAIKRPGARAGWTPEWRELLRRLRAHPAPVVARLARGVYTSSE